MKAIIQRKFGSVDVLELHELPKLEPKANEVLIKVYASAVTHEEPGMRSSPGFNGLFKPKNPVLGEEFAGEIEELGNTATRFKVGDRVYGITDFGSHAEYLCLSEDQAILPMPESLSFREAAAIPNGAVTALPFLRELGKIQPGQEVLVNGASGSVGTAAVQIAKYFDTEVTGVCSTANLEFIRSIGADHVIDYKREDFTRLDRSFDIIFDTVGKSSFAKCKAILKSDGIYLTTVPSLEIARNLLPGANKGKRIGFMATGLRPSEKKRQDLLLISEMIEVGEYQAVIDREYALESLADAHRYVEGGHKRGSVVIIHA